jgi:hypothetical protein
MIVRGQRQAYIVTLLPMGDAARHAYHRHVRSY